MTLITQEKTSMNLNWTLLQKLTESVSLLENKLENIDIFMSKQTKCEKTKKCQPSTRDRPDLIKTESIPRRRLTRPKIKMNKMRTSKNEINCKFYKKKKCQPSTGDRLDLIKTAPVPSRGLARTKIKINRTNKLKKQKENRLAKCHSCRKRQAHKNSQDFTEHKFK